MFSFLKEISRERIINISKTEKKQKGLFVILKELK